MYTDFHDQNGNSISAATVIPATKAPIIKTEARFQMFYPNVSAPFANFGEDDYIRESLIITNSCGSDGIKLGSVNIGMLKVVVKNEKVATFQSPSDIINAWIVPVYKIEVDANTTATAMSGAYWVKEVEQLAEGVKLTCYDGMSKLDTAFSGALSGTPYQIITAASTACGVNIDSTQAEIEALPNGQRTFTLHEDNDCKTWRDVLSYLAQLMGCFVTFGRWAYGVNRFPGIVFRAFGDKSNPDDTITDSQRYTGAKFSLWDTAYAEFTLQSYALEDPNDPDSAKKMDFTYSDATVSTEGQTYSLGYNPFLQPTTPEAGLTTDQIAILHDLLVQMAKYQYTPMQISLPVGFIYDLGDVIKCSGGYANTGFAGGATDDAYGVILNETYTYGREYRIKSLDSHAGKGRRIVVPQHIYGVEWDCTNTTLLTRTDDSADFSNPEAYVAGSTTYGSPFDNLMPWSGIERVTNSDAGELVKIPKFWYKTDFNNNKHKFQIADYPAEGFSVAPAFMDRGDGKGERDYVYVGRYHCSSSDYKSASGVKPKANITRADFRTAIHNLGSDVWQWDYATFITIQMLYLVEYANWNVKETVGGGCYEGTSYVDDTFNCGGTDSMPYHTGTVSANHSDYGNCQYRYMENLWGNVCDFCDGIYFKRNTIYAIKNPADFSDTENGSVVRSRPTTRGYILAFNKSYWEGYDWFYYPSSTGGSVNQRYTWGFYDYQTSDSVVLRVGRSFFGSGDYSGLFCLNDSGYATYKKIGTGSRLMVLP